MNGEKCDAITYIYNKLCRLKTDINEHLPALMKLSSHCQSVVEMGVRSGVSTFAFLQGLRNNHLPGKRLISIDIADVPDIEYIDELASENHVDFSFWKHDSITAPIPEVDLLFIDTWHVYGHLKRELDAHHSKAKKFIVLHDTESYKIESEAAVFKTDIAAECKRTGYTAEEVEKGIGPAVVEFLECHPEWIVGVHFENNNGLTILERKTLQDEMSV